MKATRLSRQTILTSDFVSHYIDRVQLPNGRIIEEQHILDFGQPGVITLVENEKDEVLFVEIYRYPTDQTEWELPAGGIEADETAAEAAERLHALGFLR